MFEYSVEYKEDSGLWTQIDTYTVPIINKETLDESLDETQLFLACDSREEAFKPFTRFVITITERDEDDDIVEEKTLYRVVASDKVEQVGFDEGNELFNHDIMLVEATKELERYTVDNLSFTNKITIDNANQATKITNYTSTENQKKIWEDINKYSSKIQLPNNSDIYLNYPYQSPLVTNSIIIIKNIAFNTNYSIIYDLGLPVSMRQQRRKLDITRSLAGIKLIAPDGTETSVNVGDTVNFTENGTYKIVYTINDYTDIKYSELYIFWWGTWINYIPNTLFRTTEIEYSINVQASVATTQKITVVDVLKRLLDVTPTKYLANKHTASRYRGEYDYEEPLSWFDSKRPIKIGDYWGLINYPIRNYYVVFVKDIGVSDTININTDAIFTDNPRIKMYGTNQEFYLSQEFENKYSGIEAPEFIFTNKNLFEVLKEIGGVINAIPYLDIKDKDNWGTINYLQLSSEETMQGVEEEYSNSTNQYDTQNYTASYDLTVDNMTNPYSNGQGQISEPFMNMGVNFRSESVEMSEDDMLIHTSYPIYKVNHLYVLKLVNGVWTKIVLDGYVKEKSIYDTLVSYPSGITDPQLNNTKCRMVYFKQGEKDIKGLDYKVASNSIVATQIGVSIKNILLREGVISSINDKIIDLPFIVEYIPLINARIKFFKPNAPLTKISGSMFQNQSANVVDASQLGKKMVANISRTGNRSDLDSINVYHISQIPQKGQRTTDKYFVNTIYTEFGQNHLLSTISYIKDYQKLNEYININSLQRYYEISEKQSIDRYINTNMFYVFGEPSIEEKNKDFGFASYLKTIMNGTNTGVINGSILSAYQKADVEEPSVYILKPISKVYKNSITIATGNCINIITDYENNYGAGFQVNDYVVTGGTVATNGYQKRDVPYGDDKGQILSLKITNVGDSGVVYDADYTAQEITTDIKKFPDIKETLIYYYEEEPYVGQEHLSVIKYLEQEININKDNREIIHINQQHHFLSNDNNVKVGNAMTDKCPLIQNITYTTKIVFLSNEIDDYEYKINSDDVLLSYNISQYPSYTVDENGQEGLIPFMPATVTPQTDISVRGLGEGVVAKAWALVTNTNDLIVGRNEEIQDGDICTAIYLSVTSNYL